MWSKLYDDWLEVMRYNCSENDDFTQRTKMVLNLQMNWELSDSEHRSIANVDIVVGHSMIDMPQQRL